MAFLPFRESIRARIASMLLASLVFAAVGGGRAQAYCRETVDSPATGPCIEKAGSKRLKWTRSCMQFVFNEDFFSLIPLMTQKEIRDTFDVSFERWADIDCQDGRAPFFVEMLPDTTQTNAAGFVFKKVNESVVAAHSRSEWEALEHDANALALTLLWHNSVTGTILDVDMEFNTGAGRFADCEARVCGRDMMDLENTVTHEAGHVLGLGHSNIEGSTMIDDALDGETGKRSLEADDRAGYCSLDLPEYTCQNDDCSCKPPEAITQTKQVSRCAVTAPGLSSGEHGMLPIALFSLVVGLGLHRGVSRLRRATLRPASWPASRPHHKP